MYICGLKMPQRRPNHRTPTPLQPELPFRGNRGHGGLRAGAGRKPKHGIAGVAHDSRAALAARFPAHVTWKLLRGLPRLREARVRKVLLAVFAACRAKHAAGTPSASRFRVTHFAILNDHLHLLTEAADRPSLARGLQGLAIRIARALNRLWARRGAVFADRYHDRILKTPREVRNALVYVLANGKKHAATGREVRVAQPVDTFTSAPWFDGFRERERVSVRGLEGTPPPVTPPRTWLLTLGWRRHGLLSVHELPKTG